MRKLFTLTLALLASFTMWAVDLSKGATYDLTTFSTSDFTGTNDNYWKPDAQSPTYYANGSSFKPTSASDFILNADNDKITKLDGLKLITGSSSGRVRLYVNGNGLYFNSNGAKLVLPGLKAGQEIVLTYANVSSDEANFTLENATGVQNTTAKTETLTVTANGDVTVTYNSKKFYIKRIEISSSCEATDATFSATSTALVITNEVPAPSTTLNFTKGDNTSNPTYSVTKGGETTTDASIEGTTFTATAAGTYTVTATQEADGTYCEVIKQVTITVTAEVPVTACTIAGPTSGIIGQELTYTATADNATAFAWYVDDALQVGETDAEFVYTGVKGNHSIYATATNAYTATPVASDPIALNVTKLCGMLIKATTNNAVTGVVGGTYSTNNGTGDSKKLDKKKYYGVTLASGTFMAGDVFTINVTTAATNGGKCMLFADNAGTDLIIDAGAGYTSTGELTVTLPTAANGKSSIYIYRENNDNQWNPVFTWMSVTRSCEESSDASVESLTVNGVAVAKDAELNKFEYTVSTNYAEENVTVAFTIHPLATSDKVGNTFTIPTPSAGDTNGASFKVTAEDGTQVTYTVFITKAASLSDDATLKELSVAGLTLDPAFDAETTAYTVTKAYEADMPAVGDVTATANDANAKSVDIALAGNVFTITVTAEDNTTKDYTITVNDAPAIKSLSRVLFSNGFDAFIDNTNRTVKAFYLDGTTAPTATTITAGANCTAGSIEDGKIVVTGADESFVEYAVTLEAVTANTNVVEESAAAGTFDGSEAWVKAGLYMANPAGFNEGKYVLRRQLKNGDAADDQRIIAGWVRAYFFVGNASRLELANTTKNVKVKYAIDGGEYTETESNPIVITLESGNHMIEIVTNQSSGDCNLSAPKLVKRVATAIDNTADEIKAVKFVENGQLFIRRGEKVYTITGEEVK